MYTEIEDRYERTCWHTHPFIWVPLRSIVFKLHIGAICTGSRLVIGFNEKLACNKSGLEIEEF